MTDESAQLEEWSRRNHNGVVRYGDVVTMSPHKAGDAGTAADAVVAGYMAGVHINLNAGVKVTVIVGP